MVRTSSKRDKIRFSVRFDIEGQGQSLHKTTVILTQFFSTFGPNLVILAWMGPGLSHVQAIVGRVKVRTQT